MSVVRMPSQLRLASRTPKLGEFVRLDRGAEGEFGWLHRVGALLIEPEEKGKVLVAVFDGPRPFQFRGRSAHEIQEMMPEVALAAVCLRDGIATMGCGLYTRLLPTFQSAVFFSHAGINRFFYAMGKRHSGVIRALESNGAEVIRVEI